MTTHFRTCPLCEAMCGLEIEVEGDQVTRVRGDRDDVWSKGFICPKGASLGQLHHDPDRLRAPPVKPNGSLLSYPDLIGEVTRIRERGGRTIVIDPRRTGTAEKADEWLPILPGTDAALLLAVVSVLDEEDLVSLGPLEGRVLGVEDVLTAAREFRPEDVAAWCGIDAARIRELARDLASTPRAVVYGRIGLCTQEFGTLASWLVDVV